MGGYNIHIHMHKLCTFVVPCECRYKHTICMHLRIYLCTLVALAGREICLHMHTHAYTVHMYTSRCRTMGTGTKVYTYIQIHMHIHIYIDTQIIYMYISSCGAWQTKMCPKKEEIYSIR
jgi:hypothetical protein